jgi:hypothetical protein
MLLFIAHKESFTNITQTKQLSEQYKIWRWFAPTPVIRTSIVFVFFFYSQNFKKSQYDIMTFIESFMKTRESFEVIRTDKHTVDIQR